MDIRLYLRVLRRFRLLVGTGLLLGVALAFLSFVRVGLHGGVKLAYRQQPDWITYSTLFVTQEGFPWGRSVIQTTPSAAAAKANPSATLYADPSRFSGLAVLYSHLATSDPVRHLMLKDGPLNGEIDAAPILASQNAFAEALPLIQIVAITHSGPDSVRLVERATTAFRSFLAQEQQLNAIPSAQRVQVTVLKQAEKPKMLRGRSFTLPVVIVLLMLLVSCGLAFLLENLRPRQSEEAGEELSLPARLDATRRSA
jgi:hypothetical protein